MRREEKKRKKRKRSKYKLVYDVLFQRLEVAVMTNMRPIHSRSKYTFRHVYIAVTGNVLVWESAATRCILSTEYSTIHRPITRIKLLHWIRDFYS